MTEEERKERECLTSYITIVRRKRQVKCIDFNDKIRRKEKGGGTV